jgi:hypothetical protein
VQVVLAVRLLAMAEELGEDQKHATKNRVRQPNGDPLSEVAGEFSLASESLQTEWLNGIMLVGNVPIAKPLAMTRLRS